MEVDIPLTRAVLVAGVVALVTGVPVAVFVALITGILLVVVRGMLVENTLEELVVNES